MAIKIEPIPMMEDAEIAAMRVVLEERRPKRVLEWGSGGSTLYWPAMFPEIEWISVEHDPKYAAAIESRLPANVTLFRLDFPAYYQQPMEMGKFDLIIVDGRQRVKCIDVTRVLLEPGGVVLLHDAGRERYHAGMDLYQTVVELSPPKPGRDPRGLVMLSEPMPIENSKRGVVYMCWGDPATREAEASMQSLWQHEPAMAVLVVGDANAVAYYANRPQVMVRECAVDPFTAASAFGFKAGRIKPLLAGISPFERTLYVDAETEFKASPMVGFDLLDRWDIVIAEAETRSLGMTFANNRTEADQTAADLGTPHILYHNSGMLFWRKNKATDRLFHLWSEEWQRYNGWDEQIALLRALLKSDVLFLNVPYTWNCRGPELSYLVYHRFASLAARKYKGSSRAAPLPRNISRLEKGLIRPLVRVELGAGVIVKCKEGDEEKVRAQYERQKGPRAKWRP